MAYRDTHLSEDNVVICSIFHIFQESIASHVEQNALHLEMDTQRHVIRQMHGRRRVHMNPAELVPTKDVKKPVYVTGGWTVATEEEVE